jgi:hypothetical protein
VVEVNDLHCAGRQVLGQLGGERTGYVGEEAHGLCRGERLEDVPHQTRGLPGTPDRTGAVDVGDDDGDGPVEGSQPGVYLPRAAGAEVAVIGDQPQDLSCGEPGRADDGRSRQLGRNGRRVELGQGKPLAELRVAQHQETGDQP